MTSGTPGRPTGKGVVVTFLAIALLGIGAARVPTMEPASLCLPLLMNCGSPTQSPDPSPAPAPTRQPTPGDASPAPAPAPATPDPAVTASSDVSAPIFTLPAAQLGGSSLSFSGLPSVSLVTVPLADGTRTPVIKLTADGIVIKDFLLDVRKATGPSLVTNSDQMELRGHVKVYLDSATATLADGSGITLGAATPLPGSELPSTLLRVNLGLVGVTADNITFTRPHQSLK